ncbi:MAG TPA: DoxX family protein [Phycisphaerales bacterium]|nr:DoxX family protein [Phycisphaerales bacterium]HRQ76198.1 DoxX family protein [Phycisphaerales bacterium]
MASPLRTMLIGGHKPASVAADLGLTLLRIAAGLLMAPHGWGKIPPSGQFLDGVSEMGFPMPIVFAWGAALSEFVGGLLLAAGLFTRPAAFMMAGTMVVAAFVAHAGDPISVREMALLYLFIAIAFMFNGSGRFGLDRFLR